MRLCRPGAFRRPQAPGAGRWPGTGIPRRKRARGGSGPGRLWARSARVMMRARRGPGASLAIETLARLQVGKQAVASVTFPSGAAGSDSPPGATPGHPGLLRGLRGARRQSLLPGRCTQPEGMELQTRGLRCSGLCVGHCRHEIRQVVSRSAMSSLRVRQAG